MDEILKKKRREKKKIGGREAYLKGAPAVRQTGQWLWAEAEAEAERTEAEAEDSFGGSRVFG